MGYCHMGQIKNNRVLKSLGDKRSGPVNASLGYTNRDTYSPAPRDTGPPEMSQYRGKKIHQQVPVHEQNEGDHP